MARLKNEKMEKIHSTETLNLISTSIIVNQLALNTNEKIKFTDVYKHELKKNLNQTIKELVKAEEKEFDKLFGQQEKGSCLFYDITSEMVNEITETGLEHYHEITQLIRAYKKSPKSIIGIINKINKNEKS